jgi:AmmeMemoRadiSam system protein A
MVPMSLTRRRFTEHEEELLLRTALNAIRRGVAGDKPYEPDAATCPERLAQQAASFVTLHTNGALRGCIGSLQAYEPLILNVARNARAAAVDDPRFPPLAPPELERIDIHISVLGPAEPMPFETEEDLIGQLRPNLDGLILEDRGKRATFLPSVWESLPERRAFLGRLKEKAGLPADYWSGTLRVYRYNTESLAWSAERVAREPPLSTIMEDRPSA